MDLVHQDRELDGDVGRRILNNGADSRSAPAGFPTKRVARALVVGGAGDPGAALDSVLRAVSMADTAGLWITPGGAMECSFDVATVASGIANYLSWSGVRGVPHHEVEVLNHAGVIPE